LPDRILDRTREVLLGTDDTAPWLVDWIAITCVTGIVITLMDAALIERKLSYFSGGFLSEDHITGFGQAAAFVTASLLADMAIGGVIVAVVLWLCGNARIVRRLAVPATCVAVLVPAVVANFITYQLLQYLGDAFDFSLMFDLAGRSPSEILAVSSTHLFWFGGLASVAAVGIAGAVTILRSRGRSVLSRVERVTFRRALAPAAILLCLGLVGTTALRLGSVVVNTGVQWKPAGRLLGGAVQTASDFDRDGASMFSRPGDPALFDARIRPYAADLPGNGIDEDGVGGDLPASLPPYTEPPVQTAPWRIKPDVILVFLESVRADVIGQSYDGHPVTPTLNAIAAAGVSSARAYSHNGFTVQSRQHLFTGSVADIRGRRTLIDDFAAQGYQTAYFSAQDESFGGAPYDIGFARADVAYDARMDVDRRYTAFTTPGSLAVPYQVVVERVSSFLRERSRDKPLFLVLNIQDTHFPYRHATIRPILSAVALDRFEIAPARAEALRAMYLNTTRNVDDALGGVLDQARTALGRDPGVIVLSDHGESLYDEGFLGHGYALNDAQTRIPLIVANLPIVVEEPFGQADLRDAIAHAFVTAAPGAGPQLQQNPSKSTFQYLGSVEHPAQIALTSLDGQVAHDFRTGRARIDRAGWRRPEALAPDEFNRWRQLVRQWEQMVLARAERRSGAGAAHP
jgi:glucan phosphoethanolaminetransferase (alkaline phosphatase superfamily)